MVPLSSSLLRLPLTSSHDLLFLEKMMWQKHWVRLMSGKFLKVKNMQKQENLLCSVKTKSKGIV
jgi:hypothetical protein